MAPTPEQAFRRGLPAADRDALVAQVPSFADRAWYVVCAQPNREIVALLWLLRIGFTAWLPTFLRTVRHARKAETRRAPVFPGYLFVGVAEEQAFAPILSTVGVAAVIKGDGGRPSEIRGAFLDGVARAIVANDLALQAPAAPVNPFFAGQSVRVADGPLTGFEGICTLPDGERTMVLLRFLGADRPIPMATRSLRPVE